MSKHRQDARDRLDGTCILAFRSSYFLLNFEVYCRVTALSPKMEHLIRVDAARIIISKLALAAFYR